MKLTSILSLLCFIPSDVSVGLEGPIGASRMAHDIYEEMFADSEPMFNVTEITEDMLTDIANGIVNMTHALSGEKGIKDHADAILDALEVVEERTGFKMSEEDIVNQVINEILGTSNVQSQDLVFEMSELTCDGVTSENYFSLSGSDEKIDGSNKVILNPDSDVVFVWELTFPKPFTDSMLMEGTIYEVNGIEMEIPRFKFTFCSISEMDGIDIAPLDGQNCGEAGKYAMKVKMVFEDGDLDEVLGNSYSELITMTDNSGNNFGKCKWVVSVIAEEAETHAEEVAEKIEEVAEMAIGYLNSTGRMLRKNTL